MKSLKELYKIGFGPSSSHTMAPAKAATLFRDRNPDCDSYKVILYGSLALTGKGHLTDEVIKKVFSNKVEVVFDSKKLQKHSNTMELFAYIGGVQKDMMKVISIGGGDISIVGERTKISKEVYPHSSFEQIKEYCVQNGINLAEYAQRFEDSDVRDYIALIWQEMKNVVERGLNDEGKLPGGLNVEKRAKILFDAKIENESELTCQNRKLSAYAFAVGEQNACGNKVVTAPTCGSAGVLPAIFYFYQQTEKYSDEQIISALLAAGILGNLVKENASISGAECGCQAELGTACSMAAGGLAFIKGMSIEQIEYSAEIAMEHYLGLTCDPICGLVQIPCIERNAVSAMRAINAVSLAEFLTDSRKVSFDLVVETMYQTGKDLSKKYKETAKGGLAKYYNETDNI